MNQKLQFDSFLMEQDILFLLVAFLLFFSATPTLSSNFQYWKIWNYSFALFNNH